MKKGHLDQFSLVSVKGKNVNVPCLFCLKARWHPGSRCRDGEVSLYLSVNDLSQEVWTFMAGTRRTLVLAGSSPSPAVPPESLQWYDYCLPSLL